MKGKCINITNTSRVKLGKLYEIISVSGDGYYTISDENGIKVSMYKKRFEPIYEVGDMVKIVKNITEQMDKNGQINSKKELNKTSTISQVYSNINTKYPYYLKDLMFTRSNEELEIVKTKYQLEQENNNNKIVHNIKAKPYEKGDILKITKGKLKDIEGVFIYYIESYDKVLIQIDDESKLSVNSTNVMLSKKKVNNIHKDEKYDDIVYDLDGFSHPVQVRFHKNHTYVTLDDGTKARTSCHPNDEFNVDEGIKRGFYRAMSKRYDKALEKLNVEN